MIYKEIYFDKGNGNQGCGVIFIQYGLGVRMALEGIESIFDEDKGFTNYMKGLLKKGKYIVQNAKTASCKSQKTVFGCKTIRFPRQMRV